MLHVQTGTNRAGGSLTWNGETLLQANSTQKAAASPEGSTELWYLLNPLPATANLIIPNTGALTIRYVVAAGSAVAGGASFLRSSNGGNGTSTNPTPGAAAYQAGDIGFATSFSGATTYAPGTPAGTTIQWTDDGAFGGATQYTIPGAAGSTALGWTFSASDDWGAVSAFFGEYPPTSIEGARGFDATGDISVTEKIR